MTLHSFAMKTYFNVAFLALTFAVASSAADDLGDSATGKFYALSTWVLSLKSVVGTYYGLANADGDQAWDFKCGKVLVGSRLCSSVGHKLSAISYSFETAVTNKLVVKCKIAWSNPFHLG